ncbi:unnamed protein product [Brassicogethes aeneus]|uniref:Uncharacterized protein n=1 Tax=Brassicogethes aeneus TaxID=1431903 RepID=A0A9P0AQT5_BRAAE|nr:unnamed protein product [Brassicogethes aeneus]
MTSRSTGKCMDFAYPRPITRSIEKHSGYKKRNPEEIEKLKAILGNGSGSKRKSYMPDSIEKKSEKTRPWFKRNAEMVEKLKAMGVLVNPEANVRSNEKGSGLKRKSLISESTKSIGPKPIHNDLTNGYVSTEKPKRNHLTVLSSHDSDSPKRPSKMRKLEPSIRKELFKSKLNSKIPSLNTSNSSLAKPLESIDEMEPLENSMGGSKEKPFKFKGTKVAKTNLRFTKMQSPKIKKTPIRSSRKSLGTPTDKEFLDIEKEIVNTSSPLSSMCDLLKSTGLNSPTNIRTENTLEESLRNIEHILEIDNIEFNKYKKLHEENRQKIYNILSEIRGSRTVQSSKKTKNDNKENMQKRSSPRLLMKSPILAPNKANIVVSPLLVAKTNDLRKSMLTRNLSKNIQQMGTSSSKEQKVEEMYNSYKNNCSILCTPKGVPDPTESGGNKSYSLSRKVHNQCMMLLDTPQQNKN